MLTKTSLFSLTSLSVKSLSPMADCWQDLSKHPSNTIWWWIEELSCQFIQSSKDFGPKCSTKFYFCFLQKLMLISLSATTLPQMAGCWQDLPKRPSNTSWWWIEDLFWHLIVHSNLKSMVLVRNVDENWRFLFFKLSIKRCVKTPPQMAACWPNMSKVCQNATWLCLEELSRHLSDQF